MTQRRGQEISEQALTSVELEGSRFGHTNARPRTLSLAGWSLLMTAARGALLLAVQKNDIFIGRVIELPGTLGVAAAV